jgi:ubiquitin C-terminal hydrolase
MNNNQKISIYDCLSLFTKSEEINDIQCEKCKKKTLFKKTLEIERLPKYLVLVLKRFKYILTSSVKIQKLINFPLEELYLHDFVSQKDINYKYNLFGVINHIGSLEGGHYYSIFNINGKYIEFDDSQVSENRGGIETNKVYMLIYKMDKAPKGEKNINFIGLMNRAYKIYLNRFKFKYLFNYIFDKKNNIIEEYSHKCEFYYGEPVTI